MPENIRKRGSKWDLMPQEHAQPATRDETSGSASKLDPKSLKDSDNRNSSRWSPGRDQHSKSMPPSTDSWNDQSRNISPKDGWSRQLGSRSSRSRSRSRDKEDKERSRRQGRGRNRSRSRSPIHGFRSGDEGWDERRSGSRASYRNSAAGRSSRGYPHEDGTKKNPNGHHENDAVELAGSRFERGRSPRYYSKKHSSDPGAHGEYPEERSPHAHGSQHAGARQKPDQPRPGGDGSPSFDFRKGMSQRGWEAKGQTRDSFPHRDVVQSQPEGRPRDCSPWEKRQESMEMDAEWKRDSSSSRSTLAYSALGHESSHDLPGQPLQYIGDKKYAALTPDSSQSASAAHIHHSSQEVPPSQHHPQTVLQNAFLEQRPAVDRNGRSTWESDRIIINTSTSQDKVAAPALYEEKARQSQKEATFSHPIGQNQFVISQPSAAQGFGAAGHSSQRVMPFLRPAQQPPPSSLPLNGQAQFVVPQTAPNMQGFQMAGQSHHLPPPSLNGQIRPILSETLKTEGQMQLGQAGQPSYQISTSLFNRQAQQTTHLLQSSLQGQFIASSVPQMANNFSMEKQTQVNPSEPLNKGQPHHQIPPFIGQGRPQAIHSLPSNEQTQFMAASQPLQDGNLGTDQHKNSEPVKMAEHLEIDALKAISSKPASQRAAANEKVAQLSSLTASLSQIFGNGQQLPQLYAALNPHHAPGLVARPFSHPGPGSCLQPDLAPLAAPANVGEHGKAEISRMSPGLPSNPAEQQQIAAPPMGEEAQKAENPPKMAAVTDPVEKSAAAAAAAAAAAENGNSAATTTTTAAAQEKEKEKDGEGKKPKEGKGVRVFKCTLVEFVKEVLRPTWKEGQMSKEAHKTIVKKAVDKVVSTLDGNIPHTKERIDLYMSYSKEKLTKLVQAYVEKYMKT